MVPHDLPSPIRLCLELRRRASHKDPPKLWRRRERSFSFAQAGAFIAAYMMSNRKHGTLYMA
jgi:hypothetical protein